MLLNTVKILSWPVLLPKYSSSQFFVSWLSLYKRISTECCFRKNTFITKISQLCYLTLLKCVWIVFLSSCPQVGMDTSQPDKFVYVKSENLTTKYIVHTLFHVLGRYHEHQRSDRDQYIIIDWNAVHQGNPPCSLMCPFL